MASHSSLTKEKAASSDTGAVKEQVLLPKKPRGGRPSRHAIEALNQRILDVAASLFSSQGFAATSMEQIASVCGAGKDTIYRRYPSKAALFTALLQGLQSETLMELDSIAKIGGTSLERLRVFARKLLSINLRPEMIALNRVALGEAVVLGSLQPTSAAKDPIMARLSYLVSAAQADGYIIEGEALFIAEQILYATSIRPLISTMLGQGGYQEIEQQEQYFNQAWELFLKGGGVSFER